MGIIIKFKRHLRLSTSRERQRSHSVKSHNVEKASERKRMWRRFSPVNTIKASADNAVFKVEWLHTRWVQGQPQKPLTYSEGSYLNWSIVLLWNSITFYVWPEFSAHRIVLKTVPDLIALRYFLLLLLLLFMISWHIETLQSTSLTLKIHF